MYSLNNQLDDTCFNSYEFESTDHGGHSVNGTTRWVYLPEHQDMISRETFRHFANLMTGTISVFFCLAHDIYASARSVQELSLSETAGVLYRQATESYLRISSANMVNISLNMHGTCAVQKMIDFLSTG